MPLPEIVAANAPAAIGRHVFVSYSHKDAKLAQAFADALYALAGNAEELGLARDRIFFDRGKLLAGDDWSDSIDSALRVSDLLLFLVSTASLNSTFCLERELKIAAQQGKTIVPVLLSPTPEWGSRKLPGDERARTLGALNAVPLDEKGPQPISGGTWANRSAALAQTMTQIAARLRRDAGPAVVAAAPATALHGAAAARRPLAPLLPNLCNQMPSEQSFENGLEAWSADRALMVLVKGEFPDHTVGFWERLRVKNLADYCEQVLSRPLRESRPLLLPRAADAGTDPADLVRAVRRQLSDALTGKPRTLANGEALAALLAADDGVRLLEVTLPQDTVEGTGALLQALLAVLDDVPAGAVMSRLAVAVLVEEPALVAEEKLAQRLGLASARTCVIETRKLQPLSVNDVEIWHRAHALDRALALSEEQFIRRLFGDAQQLRHLLFDQRVRPLLGLAKEEVSR